MYHSLAVLFLPYYNNSNMFCVPLDMLLGCVLGFCCHQPLMTNSVHLALLLMGLFPTHRNFRLVAIFSPNWCLNFKQILVSLQTLIVTVGCTISTVWCHVGLYDAVSQLMTGRVWNDGRKRSLVCLITSWPKAAQGLHSVAPCRT